MTAALEGGEWSAARNGRNLTPGKTRYPFCRRLGGPQGRSRRTQNLVPTGIPSRTDQPVVSRYTVWATRPINIEYNHSKIINDGSVGIVTRIRLGQLRKSGWIPYVAKWFSSYSSKDPYRLWDPSGILVNQLKWFLPRLKGWNVKLNNLFHLQRRDWE